MRIANRPALSRTAHALVLSTAASLALLLMLVAGSDSIVQAQTPDTPTPEATQGPGDWDGMENLPPIEGKLNPPQYPNMDSNLNHIIQQVETGQFTAHAAATNAPLHQEKSVAVTLYVTEGYIQTIRDFLEANGASPRNIGADYIEAYISVSLLPEASTQEGVISIRTIIPPEPGQGTVVSEGAAAHGAPAWHAAGLKGQSVKIGIIDTGFEGFQSLMGTELPSSVEARCYTDVGVFTFNLADCDNSDGGKHGTAVAEVVFDIAPEAIYYISGIQSKGDISESVAWMIGHDVDVINMSVTWTWDGPGDGTSPYSDSPLRSVDTAVADSITWVNAAGNTAERTWFGSFSDKNDSDYWHNFEGDDECNNVELVASERIRVQLRWDSRWGGATRDLDIYLLQTGGGTNDVVALSENEQSGGIDHDPYEFFSFTPDTDGNYCLAIRHYGGSQPPWIQLQTWSRDTLEYHTSNGSIGNPSESANSGLLAVGAANWRDTSEINYYSSRGPTPDDRIKPDIVGASGGRTAVYRSTDNPEGYVVGTSSSAPHIAGLSALVTQRFPDYTPQQVTNYIKTHAEVRGSVPNNTWGYGFAKLAASDAATPTPEPTPPADPCVENLEADSTIQGSWSDDCPSESRAGNYARFYTFTLDEPSDVAITLESALDTYLYVREGAGRDGSVVDENNDHDTSEFSLASTTDSSISESLAAGTYTIEATTFIAGVTGGFTLTISSITDPVVDDDALLDRYDTDNDGQINKNEVIAAVRAYFAGQITKAEVIRVLRLYFSGQR